jgi:peptide/nickel transport system substrate-binding protein/oligopeptide transport system substrate-binding protein
MKSSTLAALLVLALASPSCRPPQQEPGATPAPVAHDARTMPPSDGYLRYRLREDPPELDPGAASDVVSAAVLLNVFEGLVSFDPETLIPQPAVAESWTISDDGRVYDFKVRPGVFFHGSGREVTADDVVYSFQRLLDPKLNLERRWILEPVLGADDFEHGRATSVKGLEAVSPSDVRITLTEPFAPFLSTLCMESVAILPREVYDVPKEEAPYLRHPVGCGPFEFVEWQQGNFLKVKAFEKYWGGRPKLNGVTFRFMQDKLTAVEAYKNGELDVVDEIPAGQRGALKAELGDQYKKWPQLGTYYFGFNQENPPFKGNKKLRQAFNHAVNRTYICEKLEEGKDTPAYGILPPGLPGHDPATVQDPYDPELAKKLLAEAGYPEGKGLAPIVLYYNTDDSHQRVAQQVQQDLAAIGVTIELRNSDWASYLKLVEGHDNVNSEVAFYRMGWIADYPDPDNFMTVRLSCDYFGPKGNYDRYCNPEFEKLIDEARRLTKMEDRIPLYHQAEHIAVDDAVWLFIYYYGEEALVKPYVEGFALSPQGDYTAPLERVSFKTAG